MNDDNQWTSLSWEHFCDWLQGRRVVRTEQSWLSEEMQTLIFTDGFVAELRSNKTDGYPAYSEYTPGSDGHLTLPTVRVSNTPRQR